MATENSVVEMASVSAPIAEARVPKTDTKLPKAKRGKVAKPKTPKSKGKKSPAVKKNPAAKKSLVAKKPSSTHPSYQSMINEAIETLKERTGSSQYAITRFVEDKHPQLPGNYKKMLLASLKRLVIAQKIVKVKGSFKLPSKAVAGAAKASAPLKVKKKVATLATKPKTLASKTKSVAKTKAAKPAAAKGKAKPVAKTSVKAKPTAATKPKPAAKAPAAKPKATATAKVTHPRPASKDKPAKVAKTSSKTTPSKKPAKAVSKKAPAARKALMRSAKPKNAKKTPSRKAKMG